MSSQEQMVDYLNALVCIRCMPHHMPQEGAVMQQAMARPPVAVPLCIFGAMDAFYGQYKSDLKERMPARATFHSVGG